MKNTIGFTSAAMLLTFFWTLGASTTLHAKKSPKVDLCHFDGDTGLYKLKNVSMNAQNAHLRHGDGLPGEENPEIGIVFDDECNPITAPHVFAHAFIEMENIDRIYDPSTDFTIALFEDTNGDGVPSAGDVVRMGSFPLNLSPENNNDLGTWQVSSHVALAASYLQSSNTGVFVQIADQNFLTWRITGFNEEFTEDNLGGVPVLIRDFIGSDQVPDFIEVFPTSLSNPDPTQARDIKVSPSDDGFIQVLIN